MWVTNRTVICSEHGSDDLAGDLGAVHLLLPRTGRPVRRDLVGRAEFPHLLVADHDAVQALVAVLHRAARDPGSMIIASTTRPLAEPAPVGTQCGRSLPEAMDRRVPMSGPAPAWDCSARPADVWSERGRR